MVLSQGFSKIKGKGRRVEGTAEAVEGELLTFSRIWF